VPERDCVAGDLHAGAGVVSVAGDENDGIDVDSDEFAGSRATPRVELDGSVDLGVIRVVNDNDVVIDDDGGRWDNEDGSVTALEHACSVAR
jgi:hypothetical protein